MKVNLLKSLVLFATVFICLAANGFGQMFKASPFDINNSELVVKIRAAKVVNPKMTPVEFAAAANTLLDKNGIAFTFSFDAATCDKIRKVKTQQKDPNAPVKLGATLRSVDAQTAALALPEPNFTSLECGDCFIQLPVLEVTDQDFITIVTGVNIKFHLPANFYANDATLFDSKNRSTIKRKWKIPFRAVPIGISYDENVIYLGFDDPELSTLSIAVFGEGVFQITTREEAEEGGKGKIEAAKTGNAVNQTVRFDRWENTYFVSFKPKCPN